MTRPRDIRYLALDLDGTLLTGDYVLSDRTVAACARARSAGLAIVVASGRGRESALPWIVRLGGADGVIGFNGATAYECGPEGLPLPEPFLSLPLPEEPARALVARSRELGIHFHAFIGPDWYFERRFPETDFYERRSGFPGKRIDFGSLPRLSFEKAMFIGKDESLDAAAAFASGLGLATFRSSASMLEVVAPGVSKAAGVEAWLARRGGRMEEVLAFGDAANDEALLLAAGIGVAMGDADPAMKDRVGRSALGVREDGAARWIEDFLDRREAEVIPEASGP